ncbi:MAG: class I SAM-dependent RNA methyltransferase [Lentisphaeria bacterium]|nr:class I SAM-dependent RNA methyltransferase [Lentisphaeria bacterium]
MENILELYINNFAFGGDGTAILPEGKVCFIPHAVPGDLVRAEITVNKKNFARAVIREIMTSSPLRSTESICPRRKSKIPCPACVYADVVYSAELDAKQKQLEFFLRKFEPAVIHPPFPSPNRTGYRNKITLSCENGVAGYRAEDNKTLIPVNDCALAQKAIREAMGQYTPSANQKRVVFRWTPADGVHRTDAPSAPACLTEQVGPNGKTFKVPLPSFFQVNMAVANELANRVLGYIKQFQPEYLVELYSGSGIFSILAAECLPSLHCTGVELDGEAVRIAAVNAEGHGVADRCRFYSDDAACFRKKLRKGLSPEQTLLLTDPPRTGMAKEVIAEILKFQPERIVYISCGPDMLRRDLDLLSGHYHVQETALLDMFPCTTHFESITLLEKRQ